MRRILTLLAGLLIGLGVVAIILFGFQAANPDPGVSYSSSEALTNAGETVEVGAPAPDF